MKGGSAFDYAAERVRRAVAFIAVLFAFTWTWGILIAPQWMASGDLRWFLAGLLPNVWAPTILAIVFVGVSEGPIALRREVRSRLRAPQSWMLLATAVVVPAAAITIAIAMARASGAEAPFIPADAWPFAFGLQAVTGATGEEFGWRGYVLTRLQPTIGIRAAAVTMAVLWATWHVPAFFSEGMPQRMMPLAPSLVFIFGFGLFLASLFFRARGSILPTMTAHFALNCGLAVGGAMLSSSAYWWTLAVLFVALGCVTIVAVATELS